MDKHMAFQSAGPRDATLDVDVGQSVRVEVPGRASSGYKWSIRSDTSDLPVEKQAPSADKGSAGVGASPPEVFAVHPQAPGDFKLELNLKRPWESEPLDTRTLTLKVR